MKQNRNQVLKLRLSEHEKSLLEAKAKENGVSLSELSRSYLLAGFGVSFALDEEEAKAIDDLRFQMRMLGQNLNSMLVALNIGRMPKDRELARLIEDLVEEISHARNGWKILLNARFKKMQVAAK